MPRRSAEEAYNQASEEIERLTATSGLDALLSLVRFTTNADCRIREKAVDGIWGHWANGLSDPKIALVAVRAAVTDSNDCVRDIAVEALGELGNRSDVKRLLVAARDDEWAVRCSAAASLGAVGGKRAMRQVCRMLTEDPEPCVRMWAATAFLDSQDPEFAGILAEAECGERHPVARRGILASLVRFDRWEYLDDYLGMLDVTGWAVQSLTAKGLSELAVEGRLQGTAADKVRDTLAKLDLDALHRDVRESVEATLAALQHRVIFSV